VVMSRDGSKVWEEVASEVALSAKVSLSEKVMLVLLAIEAALSRSSRFLSSRQVLRCAIKPCAPTSRVCHQAVCAIKPCTSTSRMPSRCLLSRRVLDLTIKVGIIEVDSGLCY
jgi:hypothetical protein